RALQRLLLRPGLREGDQSLHVVLHPPHARAPPAAADRARGADGARYVKLFDVLLGRTKPAQPNLDHLFGLPGAEITLEASAGLRPTGQAGVCFKTATGQQFAQTAT